jgi:hypothetical protein
MGRTLHAACFALASTALGCASHALPSRPALPDPPQRTTDDSPLCNALVDQFIGLPTKPGSSTTPSASVGRWWIRSCTATHVPGGLRLKLTGPGWYFVDERGSDFVLRQQVPFTLALDLDSEPHLGVKDGVVALWLEPRRKAELDLRLTSELEVKPHSAWGTLLSTMSPGRVRDAAAERISAMAQTGLSQALRDGATATYDLRSGQADGTTGRLEGGKTPPRAFADGLSWSVNERLLLPPSATQVVGPIQAGPARIDVRVESGAGIAYQPICADAMAESYAAFASGHPQQNTAHAGAGAGQLSGTGSHSVLLPVQQCQFYLVVSPLRETTALASLRVRT